MFVEHLLNVFPFGSSQEENVVITFLDTDGSNI